MWMVIERQVNALIKGSGPILYMLVSFCSLYIYTESWIDSFNFELFLCINSTLVSVPDSKKLLNLCFKIDCDGHVTIEKYTLQLINIIIIYNPYMDKIFRIILSLEIEPRSY